MLLKTFVATLCVIGVALADQSPVLLWGRSSPAKPALRTVPNEEFYELAKSQLADNHMIVAIQEKNLSGKDFSCSNDEAQTCFANLQGAPQRTYYASVDSPTEALRAAAVKREYNSIDSTGQLSSPIECEAGKVVFVTFDDSQSGDRASTLEAHDAAIEEFTKKLDCPTVFMYMSTPNSDASLSRKRREIAATDGGGHLISSGFQLFIYYTDFLFANEPVTLTGVSVTNHTMATADSPLTAFNVSITTNTTNNLSFQVYLSQSYYTVYSVRFGDNEFFNTSISAPLGFSYFCGNQTLSNANISRSDQSIRWNSFQMQAQFIYANSTAATWVFGDAWHCVGFFSPGILSGLFVAALMLLITFVGVCWMMDINTMDRFDDPKGKTITINASE